MDKTLVTPIQPVPPAVPDLAQVKARQRAAWSSGDYAVVGTTLQIVGEELCEALDLRAGQKVLDVAAGNGNASLAAARRWCQVTATDYVPGLLARAGERAGADRLDVTLREADAEALPFPDGAFDAVRLDLRGHVHPEPGARGGRARPRLRPGREDRPGQLDAGRIHRPALPDHRPVRPASGRTPVAGALGYAGEDRPSSSVRTPDPSRQGPGPSPSATARADHWLDVFRSYYGPVLKAFAALDPGGQAALAGDLLALIHRLNRSGDSTMVVPGEYLEVVIARR